MNKNILAVATIMSLVSSLAVAMPNHGGMQMNHAQTESAQAYEDANNKMHSGMMIQFTGNADVDFVRGMIPHHQGAIDMARVQLKYGKNAEIRKLAQEVIKAQEQEIKFMQDWLKKNDK